MGTTKDDLINIMHFLFFRLDNIASEADELRNRCEALEAGWTLQLVGAEGEIYLLKSRAELAEKALELACHEVFRAENEAYWDKSDIDRMKAGFLSQAKETTHEGL